MTILLHGCGQVWGKLFSLGSDRGRSGFFYFVAAALYLVQLGLARASGVLALPTPRKAIDS
jgi:hypothetical protein|eukprot:COSAG02_NODE_2918_length_7752_cov_4.486215_6_plen_61_part_00